MDIRWFHIGAPMGGNAVNILEHVSSASLPAVLLGIFLEVGWLSPLDLTSSMGLKDSPSAHIYWTQILS